MHGFAAVASPLGHSTVAIPPHTIQCWRADDETRTRDPHLGKVMRYQLRYIRKLSTLSALNARINSIRTGPVPTNRHVIHPFLSLLLNCILVIPAAGGGAFVMRLPWLIYRGSFGVMTSGFGSFGCGV